MLTRFQLVVLLAALTLTACAATPTVSPQKEPVTAPAPAPVEEMLPLLTSFYLISPLERTSDPTSIIRDILAAPDAAAFSDADLSRRVSEVVSPFTSTGEPFLFIRTSPGAVVSVPDYGLYLCDTDCPQLTEWNRGLTDLDVFTTGDEIGILYRQRYGTEREIAHFIRATPIDGVLWASPDTETWWLNALDADVIVSEDLETLAVTGQATFTSDVIDTDTTNTHPQMALTWAYDSDASIYRPTPNPAHFETRQQFIEAAMLPSPFISLITFLERLTKGDDTLASQVTTGPEVVQTGRDFGLHISGRHYQVKAFESTDRTLTFGDLQGQFVAYFSPPAEVGGPWLIMDIRPLGALENPAAAP